MQPKALYANCNDCPLKDNPFVPDYVDERSKIIVVGEAPGETEVEEGRPFVGPSGQVLQVALGDEYERTTMLNAVCCRPKDNEKPSSKAMQACRRRLTHLIELQNHLPVVGLGKVAQETLYLNDRSIWHGNWMGAWHPAYILRQPGKSKEFLTQMNLALKGPQKRVSPEIQYLKTLDDFRTAVERCPEGALLSTDIETDQLNWYEKPGTPQDTILQVGFCWDEAFVVVIDDEMLYDTPGVIEEVQKLYDKVEITTWNGQFDAIFLNEVFGITMKLAYDAMLLRYVLDEEGPFGLKPEVTARYGIPNYEKDTIKKYMRSKNDYWSKVPFEILAEYLSYDLVYTLKLTKEYIEEIKNEELWDKPWRQVIEEAIPLFIDMQQKGMCVDVPHLKKWSKEFERYASEIADRLRKMVNAPELNVNSTQQVAVIIYDQLGLPPSKSRKWGARSTRKEAIEHLKGQHPFIDELQRYRRVTKLHSSYILNILDNVDMNDMVHPSGKIHGTEVGRSSFTNPPVQTIPRPGDITGRVVRSAVIAPKGYVIIHADYSQAELRVAAVLANEPFLLDVYEHDRDLHTEVAIAMFGENYTKEQRVMCKMFNFSYLYGGSEYSFALDAGLNIGTARAFVRQYNKVMPKLAAYRKQQFEEMAEKGYVSTRFGRRRRIPIITNVNAKDTGKASVHAPVAGGATDLTLLSAIEMRNLGWWVFLMVHDSVLIYSPIDKAEECKKTLVDVMTKQGEKYFPEVKWKVGGDILDRWTALPKQSLLTDEAFLEEGDTYQ